MKKSSVYALFVALFLAFGSLASAQTSTSTATVTATATSTPTPTSTATAVTTVTATSTRTPTSTATATSTFLPPGNNGIDYGQLSGNLKQRVAPAIDQTNRMRISGGVLANNILRMASSVTPTETVTIGTNVFEFEIVQTTTGVTTASGEWNNNTSDPIAVTVAGHGLVAGQLVCVDQELFQVLRVPSSSTMVLARGRFGTITAAHTNGTTIYKGSALSATTNIPVGLITTYTATFASRALAAAINNAPAGDGEIPIGTTGTVGTNTIYDPGSAYTTAQRAGKIVAAWQSADNTVLLTSAIPENSVLATTETLAGSNNAFSAATMTGGVLPIVRRISTTARVPTATEVAIGYLFVPLNFAPTAYNISIRVTSSGVNKAWDGGILVVGNTLVVDNSGSTDWAATDTIRINAYE